MGSSTVTLRLSVDPATGKRTLTVSYTSDADALPHEHEDAHRAIVERLVDGGIAKPGDAIVVDREGALQAADLPVGERGEAPEALRGGG